MRLWKEARTQAHQFRGLASRSSNCYPHRHLHCNHYCPYNLHPQSGYSHTSQDFYALEHAYQLTTTFVSQGTNFVLKRGQCTLQNLHAIIQTNSNHLSLILEIRIKRPCQLTHLATDQDKGCLCKYPLHSTKTQIDYRACIIHQTSLPHPITVAQRAPQTSKRRVKFRTAWQT